MAGAFRFALALAALLALSGCATLSDAQRDEAAGIARHARSTVVDCAGPDACAQPSPLQQLGQRALAESTRDAPRHYAVILDDAPDAVEVAEHGLGLRQMVDGAEAGRLVRLLDRHLVADLPEIGEVPVGVAERTLAVEQVPDRHAGHQCRVRLDHRRIRQGDAKLP